MSYADDLFDQTPAPQPVGFTNRRTTTQIVHNDGLSADELLALVAEYEKEWDTVFITERKDLAGWFKTAYLVELHGASSDGERRRATEPDTARSDARRSQELGRLV